ncbi:hypothetical protein FIBSPDRAFT_858416 [Athelia psychrophila]|uniref:DUF7137 domain-containing protein n=1 Tax=Athelia psychrophila TaxID=1759441 RepID=A0A166LYP3_9AGAM|nr:hypothetical protein FIBSPDRAFT_858416 [Fibularhizoctonia sp. CBS 109695]
MGKYSLKIWGDQGPNVQQQPGYMSENSALQFALYTPQPYTPIASGWSCSTCNGSVGAIAFHPAFLGMMITFAVMFLSGWGIIRR